MEADLGGGGSGDEPSRSALSVAQQRQLRRGLIAEATGPDLGDVKSTAAAAASESGWTTYFGQATDDCCLSEVSFQCRAANAGTGNLLLRQDSDSSVLSDASSPLDGWTGNLVEPAMQDGGSRCKRRKKDMDGSLAAVENAEDGSLVDDEACSSDCGSTMWARADANAIDGRLKVLQRLVPNADEYDSLETLDRTVEYVRCLEHKIELLEKRIVRKRSKFDVVELQDLGLCLVPLSAAVEVLKAAAAAGARFVSQR